MAVDAKSVFTFFDRCPGGRAVIENIPPQLLCHIFNNSSATRLQFLNVRMPSRGRAKIENMTKIADLLRCSEGLILW